MGKRAKAINAAGRGDEPELVSPPTAFEALPRHANEQARRAPDDVQTALEPVVEQLPSQIVAKWLASDEGPLVRQEVFPVEDIHEFRPVLRPPVPVLTVLDDDSQDEGEQSRLRGEVFAIGCTSGDTWLPNDASISGRHA